MKKCLLIFLLLISSSFFCFLYSSTISIGGSGGHGTLTIKNSDINIKKQNDNLYYIYAKYDSLSVKIQAYATFGTTPIRQAIVALVPIDNKDALSIGHSDVSWGMNMGPTSNSADNFLLPETTTTYEMFIKVRTLPSSGRGEPGPFEELDRITIKYFQDSTPPHVEFSHPDSIANSVIYGGSANLEISTSVFDENGLNRLESRIERAEDPEDFVSSHRSQYGHAVHVSGHTYKFPNSGEYIFRVYAEDSFGNVTPSEQSSRTFRIDATPPPAPEFDSYYFTKKDGKIDLVIKYKPVIDAPFNAPVKYKWTVPAEVPVPTPENTTTTLIIPDIYGKTSPLKGSTTYSFQLKATDSVGLTSISSHSVYIPPVSPQIGIDESYGYVFKDPVLIGGKIHYPIHFKMETSGINLKGYERFSFNIHSATGLHLGAIGFQIPSNGEITINLPQFYNGHNFAHQQLRFYISARLAPYDPTNQPWVLIEGLTSKSQQLPNYVPHFPGYQITVAGQPKQNNASLTLDPAEYTIGITPNVEKDLEGDTIKYQLFGNYNIPFLTSAIPATSTYRISMPFSGTYKVKAQIYDYATSDAVNPVDVTERSITVKIDKHIDGKINTYGYDFGSKAYSRETSELELNSGRVSFKLGLEKSNGVGMTVEQAHIVDVAKYKSFLKSLPGVDTVGINSASALSLLQGVNYSTLLSHIKALNNPGWLLAVNKEAAGGMYSFADTGTRDVILVVKSVATDGSQYYVKHVTVDRNLPIRDLNYDIISSIDYTSYAALATAGGNQGSHGIESIDIAIKLPPSSNRPANHNIDYYELKRLKDDGKEILLSTFASTKRAINLTLQGNTFDANSNIRFRLYAYDNGRNQAADFGTFSLKAPPAFPIGLTSENVVQNRLTFSIKDKAYKNIEIRLKGGATLEHKQWLSSYVNTYRFDLERAPGTNPYIPREYEITVVDSSDRRFTFTRTFAYKVMDPYVSMHVSGELTIRGPHRSILATVHDFDKDSVVLSYSFDNGQTYTTSTAVGYEHNIPVPIFPALVAGKRYIDFKLVAQDGMNKVISRREAFYYDAKAPECTLQNSDIFINGRTISLGFTDFGWVQNPDDNYYYYQTPLLGAELQEIWLQLKEGDVIIHERTIPTPGTGVFTYDVPESVPSGAYTLLCSATDLANNTSPVYEFNLQMDEAVPSFTNIRINGNAISSSAIPVADSLLLECTYNDDVELVEVGYQVEKTNGEIVHGPVLVTPGVTTDYIGQFKIPQAVVNGTDTRIVLLARDKVAAHDQIIKQPTPIVWDNSAPEVRVISFAGSVSNPLYFKDVSQITCNTTITDMETPNGYAIRYGVRLADTAEYQFASSLAGLSGAVSYENGSRYEFCIEAGNRAGASGKTSLGTLTYDSSQPLISNLHIESNGNDITTVDAFTSEYAVLDLNLTSTGSISEYDIRIGTALEPTAVSKYIPGNKNGHLVLNGPQALISLPSMDNGTYIVSARAFNQYGDISEKTASITINNTVDRISIYNVPYIVNTDKLAFGLKYYGNGQVPASYSVQIRDSNNLPVVSLSLAESNQGVFDDLSALVRGESYTLHVIEQGESSHSLTAQTHSFIYDDTPAIVSLTSSEYMTQGNASIKYTITEDVSSISSLEYRVYSVGASIDAQLIADWAQLPVNNTMEGVIIPNIMGMNDSDRVEVQIRTRNIDGNVCSQIVSKRFVIDNKKPDSIVISDQGQWHNLKTALRFPFIQSPDTMDRIFSMSYAITQDESLPSVWTEVSIDELASGLIAKEYEATEADTLAGHVLTLHCKVIGKNGLERIVKTDGILIDRQIPDIIETTTTNSTHNSIGYVNRVNDIQFSSNAVDNVTLQNLHYELSFYEDDSWVKIPLSNRVIPYTSSSQTYTQSLIKSPAQYDGKSIRLDVFVDDGAGNYSSCESILYSVVATPIVSAEDLSVMIDRTSLDYYDVYVNWNIDSNIPYIHALSVKHMAGNATLNPISEASSSSVYRIPKEIVNEGDYTVSLSASDILGDTISNLNETFTLDFSAPEIEVTSVAIYTHDAIQLNAHIKETFSDITEVLYAVGISGNDTLLTEGWRTIDIASASDKMNISLINPLSFNNALATDGTYLIVSLKAFNEGEEEVSTTCETMPILDKTAPQIQLLSLPEYVRSENHIGHEGVDTLEINAFDEMSGLDRIEYAAIKEGSSATPIWHTLSIEVEHTAQKVIEKLSLQLADGEAYRLALRAVDRAGISSEITSQSLMRSDRSAPEVSFHSELQLDSMNRYIVHEASTVLLPFTVTDASSKWGETVVIDGISIRTQDNELVASYTTPSDWAGNVISVPISDIQGKYEYTVTLDVRDVAGNTAAHEQKLRLNAGPTIELNPALATQLSGESGHFIPTTPGKGIVLSDFLQIEDVDGIAPGSIVMSAPDAKKVVNLTAQADDLSGEVAFVHNSPQVGNYSVKKIQVSATDTFGKKTGPIELKVLVHNTQEGELYMNEIWNTGHSLTGTVTIPNDKTLIISAASAITIEQNVSSAPIGLIVNGNIITGHGVSFKTSNESLTPWAGLTIDGRLADPATAVMHGVHIEDALRALVVGPYSAVEIADIDLRNNDIGIHAFKSFLLNGGSIENSKYYGIKEDVDMKPDISGIFFLNNGIDYYDSNLLNLNASELDAHFQNENSSGIQGDK